MATRADLTSASRNLIMMIANNFKTLDKKVDITEADINAQREIVHGVVSLVEGNAEAVAELTCEINRRFENVRTTRPDITEMSCESRGARNLG